MTRPTRVLAAALVPLAPPAAYYDPSFYEQAVR